MPEPTTVNITSVLNETPLSALQWRIFGLCAGVILLDGADSFAIGLTAPAIAGSFGMKVQEFGPVFAAGQAGLFFGSLCFGQIADRVGRRWVIILATVMFGIFSLATATAGNFWQLLAIRFLAGLGLGGAAPNVVALTAEFSPRRLRASVVTMMCAALPLGGMVIGLLASVIMAPLGWQSVYYIGGVLPLLLAAALALWVPESLGYLVARDGTSPAALRTLAGIAPRLPCTALTQLCSDEETLPGVALRFLFTEGRAAETLAIWVAIFCSSVVMVFMVSWTAALLRSVGLSAALASLVLAAFSAGSIVGSVAIGPVMTRLGGRANLVACFLATALCVVLLAGTVASLAAVALVVGLVGMFTGATQAGMTALAANAYPVLIRSTGVGWALAWGRFGAIVGPMGGGLLLSNGWGLSAVLYAVALPSLVGAATMALVALHGTTWPSRSPPTRATGPEL